MELQRRLIWAYEQFDKTVVFEHIAFAHYRVVDVFYGGVVH